MKLLKRSILFSLAYGVDFFGGSDTFDYLSYEQLYWRLENYQKVSVRGATSELVGDELVARILRGKSAQFRLTKMGREQLASFFPVTFRPARRWDLRWRVLIFERGKMGLTQRRRLRKKLTDFGFKMLSRGVYVSPFAVNADLKKWLTNNRILGAVRMLETRRFVVGDDKAFATQVWQLDTIYNKYKTLINRIERVLHRVLRAKRLTYQLKKDYRFVLFSWLNLLLEDPGLPKKLLPDDWLHSETRGLLEEIGEVVIELEREEGEKGKA